MEPVGGTFIVLATFCPVKSKVCSWRGSVSAATLHPRRSEVNSGQCTPIQPDSAHFCTFTYWGAPKFLPEQFLYILDTRDSILVSVAAEMIAFQ